MFHHTLPVPLEEKEEEEEETYDEINIMCPAFGASSLEWNYVQYNISRSRKDEVRMCVLWQECVPRQYNIVHSLVYIQSDSDMCT